MADNKKGPTRWSKEKPAKTTSAPDPLCGHKWSTPGGCPSNNGRNHLCDLIKTNGQPHMGPHECKFCETTK